jgi:outer membrane protein OmpA-like peptidoglycan-associated protein
MTIKYIFIALLLFSAKISISQVDFLEGTWQGVKVNLGQTSKDAKAIWFDFKIDKTTKVVTGNARVETPFSDYYAVKVIEGTLLNDSTIKFEDQMFGSKKNSGRLTWCLIKGELIYNSKTGYFSGDFTSPMCRSNVGKITMYKSKYKMSMIDTVSMYHSWVNNLNNDLNRGWNAYYVRDAEMKNFEFKPILFDHDKDVLKPEFHQFLSDMVKIVQSHSDLRIKIIGHTDSNGTDEYNVDLSARRAKVIKDYLVSLGIKDDKIVIEFKGEKVPKASNATSAGKQLNRRVDFEFI